VSLSGFRVIQVPIRRWTCAAVARCVNQNAGVRSRLSEHKYIRQSYYDLPPLCDNDPTPSSSSHPITIPAAPVMFMITVRSGCTMRAPTGRSFNQNTGLSMPFNAAFNVLVVKP